MGSLFPPEQQDSLLLFATYFLKITELHLLKPVTFLVLVHVLPAHGGIIHQTRIK